MNCQDFESNVDDLAREEMMEARVHAEALAHGEGCEACALRLEQQRSLSFKLRALARETSSAKSADNESILLISRGAWGVAVYCRRVCCGSACLSRSIHR